MKVLIIFNDGTRMVADNGALVLPQSTHQIKQKFKLKGTSVQIKQLETNPYDDILLNQIKQL